MRKFPEPIQNLQAVFTKLPGVGPKTALRYVYALLRMTKEERCYLERAIAGLDEIKACPTCFTHTEHDMCRICSDAHRNPSLICVVADSRDIASIEATGGYQGRYHVLGRLLNPIEGVTLEQLRVRELVKRAKQDAVTEIILALAPDVQGEMTMLHLVKALKPIGKKISRLAQGLPTGADLEFADEVTLNAALTGRREL